MHISPTGHPGLLMQMACITATPARTPRDDANARTGVAAETTQPSHIL
jgi:hypothetical protein